MTDGAAGIFGLSAGISGVVIVLGLIWWILCIVLFFKVWGMTNNISRIRDILEEWLDLEHPEIEDNESTKEFDITSKK